MPWITWVGLMAAACTTISFIPQAFRLWQTKSGKDISFGMFFIFSTGVVCWLIYGIAIKDLPIILANTLTLVLCLSIIVMKFHYGNSPRQ